jgi:hypothetical protein
MAIYVGEGITVTATATDPTTGEAITDATAQAEFFAPGKNPKSTPADRVADEGPIDMAWDDVRKAYVGNVSTASWAAGRWNYRVFLSGAYSSWEYGSFQLKA